MTAKSIAIPGNKRNYYVQGVCLTKKDKPVANNNLAIALITNHDSLNPTQACVGSVVCHFRNCSVWR